MTVAVTDPDTGRTLTVETREVSDSEGDHTLGGTFVRTFTRLEAVSATFADTGEPYRGELPEEVHLAVSECSVSDARHEPENDL